MMTTILDKIPRGNGVIKKLEDDVQSPTLSLSHSPNRVAVSWSSSDGSTYYSEDRHSLRKRRQTRPSSRPQEEQDNAASGPVPSNHPKTDDQLSQDQPKETYTTKHVQPKMTKRWPPVIAPVKKNTAHLENVDRFSAVDVATDNEDLSVVGFLTTEDTAAVFCNNGIPFEVTACKKLYEKVSPMSSGSADESSESSESSSDSSDSESDEESRKYEEKHAKWTALDTGYARQRSETSRTLCEDSSGSSIDKHAVDVVSTLKQDTVSSLECISSSDESSSDSDRSGDERTEDDWSNSLSRRENSEHTPKNSTPVQSDSKANQSSLQLDSKGQRFKQIKRLSTDTDLTTDERIKNLKAKIKRIQDLSNRSDSSTESESNLASLPPRQKKVEKIAELEDEDDNTESTEPLMTRKESNKLRQEKESKQHDLRVRDQRALELLVGTGVPLLIPVGRNEDVSALPLEGVEHDLEAGRYTSKPKRKSLRQSFMSAESIPDQTKLLLSNSRTKVIVAYTHLQLIIAQKRAQFHGKPRYEQILIVSIAALSMLFIILVLIMFTQ
mmetsp:Transcript_17153/g.39618  ORF Transcript_17153/g.39618 Transcript_17153/m.39618 type:complete len:554 (-) Transcript_17153:17-1678(-)